MNRQAREVNTEKWYSYGPCTFFEAAKEHAKCLAHRLAVIDVARFSDMYGRELIFEIETKDADDESIPATSNKIRVYYEAEILDARKGCDDDISN